MGGLPCCTGTEGQRNLVVVVWGNGGGKGKSVQVEGDSLRERRYKEAGLLFSQGDSCCYFSFSNSGFSVVTMASHKRREIPFFCVSALPEVLSRPACSGYPMNGGERGKQRVRPGQLGWGTQGLVKGQEGSWYVLSPCLFSSSESHSPLQ